MYSSRWLVVNNHRNYTTDCRTYLYSNKWSDLQKGKNYQVRNEVRSDVSSARIYIKLSRLQTNNTCFCIGNSVSISYIFFIKLLLKKKPLFYRDDFFITRVMDVDHNQIFWKTNIFQRSGTIETIETFFNISIY